MIGNSMLWLERAYSTLMNRLFGSIKAAGMEISQALLPSRLPITIPKTSTLKSPRKIPLVTRLSFAQSQASQRNTRTL